MLKKLTLEELEKFCVKYDRVWIDVFNTDHKRRKKPAYRNNTDNDTKVRRALEGITDHIGYFIWKDYLQPIVNIHFVKNYELIDLDYFSTADNFDLMDTFLAHHVRSIPRELRSLIEYIEHDLEAFFKHKMVDELREIKKLKS